MHISPTTEFISSLVSPRNVNPSSLRQIPTENDANNQAKSKYQLRKHTFTTVGPNEIRSLEHLWDFFTVQLLDQFSEHMVIGLFKRFKFGVQFNSASILFEMTA